MRCPGCDVGETVTELLSGHYGKTLEVDICHGCSGLWFDGRESAALTPGGTVALFERMTANESSNKLPLAERKSCPRCLQPLRETSDQVHATRFTYFACDAHGRYITFFQWLREKRLVRELTAKELDDLRQRVRTVKCSSCGAPISLGHASACSHCAAPISVLAPESLQSGLRQLKTSEEARNTFKPERMAEALFLKARMERELQPPRGAFDVGPFGESGRSEDLISAGIGALLRFLKNS